MLDLLLQRSMLVAGELAERLDGDCHHGMSIVIGGIRERAESAAEAARGLRGRVAGEDEL